MRLHRSPAPALLFGLIITLATVVAYSFSISARISDLRRLEADLGDRNRRATLQLLRIQNDLNQLALAMRDMLDTSAAGPLLDWAPRFASLRTDLDDALASEGQVAVAPRPAAQARALTDSVSMFWAAADRAFAFARDGRDAEARREIRESLQARQNDVSTAVGLLLLQNNESEAQTAQRVQDIYVDVQRQVYWFLSATLVTIAATGLYLIHTNRQMFARLSALSDERQELARALIATRESTLREISRELHDEFGQLLTAIGSMLRRVTGRVQDDGTRADLREISEVTQAALDNVRGLSQTLHPSILDELGLESAVEWYLTTVEKQLGLTVTYERAGGSAGLDGADLPAGSSIHVYRILQEALSNVARHAGTTQAVVRLRVVRPPNAGGILALEVEDGGRGLPAAGESKSGSRGLGLVAMRERAALLGGTLTFERPERGGTRVRLSVPTGNAGSAA